MKFQLILNSKCISHLCYEMTSIQLITSWGKISQKGKVLRILLIFFNGIIKHKPVISFIHQLNFYSKTRYISLTHGPWAYNVTITQSIFKIIKLIAQYT